jgi:hypothetical protein
MIALSEKGWTNDQLGLYWLTEVFDKATLSKTVGQYRLLIIDGHGSHTTPAFDQYCKDGSIITGLHACTLITPSTTSRCRLLFTIKACLQGTDNGSDQTWCASCRQASVSLRILPSRNKAFTAKNICSGFRAAGLVPSNPDEVLSTIKRLLTPPELAPAVIQQPKPQTPYNLVQLEQQFAQLKDCISRR